MTVKTQYLINDFIRDSRNLLKDNLIQEYLFGSYATGKQGPFSDIDILLIVKFLNPKIRSQISSLSSDYSLEHGIIISPVLKDIATWEKNKNYKTLFYNEIVLKGINLR